MSATDGISTVSLPYDAASGWPIRRACAASIFIALAIGAFFVARRLSGAMDIALPPLQLSIAAVLVLAWALAVRSVVRARWANWLAAGVLLMFATACSFPGERAIDWIVWLTAFGVFLASPNVVGVLPARYLTRPRQQLSATETDRSLQQLTRLRTADGHHVVQGTLVAEFAAGERVATVYIGFCPPFERLPQVELESSADAKVVQALHNGAQIEVRRPRAAKTATSATIEIYATDAD